MAEKQTRCPTCASIYKVSVAQLTVAQGMVCCPKCSENFNALLYLLTVSIHQESRTFHSFENSPPTQEELITTTHQIETHLLDIFDRKIENSNIDLRTYLNNLNYFNNDPISPVPSLNLSQGAKIKSNEPLNTKSMLYYLSWSLINFSLLCILLFQVVWFNPTLTDRFPLISSILTKSCAILHCDTAVQRYKMIILSNVNVKSIDHSQTQFTGQMTNQYSKSLELPLIKVILMKGDKVVMTYIMTPDEYLDENLIGIKRIPKNSPYPFKFTVTEHRNAFDQYKLDIIHP